MGIFVCVSIPCSSIYQRWCEPLRRVAVEDVIHVAGVLTRYPPQAHTELVLAICDAAHVGDKIRKRLGCVSPVHGAGTLSGVPAATIVGQWTCATLAAAASGVDLWRTQQRHRVTRRNT